MFEFDWLKLIEFGEIGLEVCWEMVELIFSGVLRCMCILLIN